MKRIACMMLFMLLMLFATALCEQPVPCYWQLRAVEVETSASDALEASALTDAVPLSGLDAEGMFRALPSSLAMSLSAARPGGAAENNGKDPRGGPGGGRFGGRRHFGPRGQPGNGEAAACGSPRAHAAPRARGLPRAARMS